MFYFVFNLIFTLFVMVNTSVIHHGLTNILDHNRIKMTRSIKTETPQVIMNNITKQRKHIEDADNSYACQLNDNKKNCLVVTEYSISQNNTLHCKAKNIEIEFDFIDVDSKKNDLATMFLTANGSLQETQQITKACIKIRRYYVNWHKTIILLFNKLHLLENEDIEETIENEFYQYSIRLWLLYKTNLYNEENDSFKYIEFIKDIGFILICTISIYLTLKCIGWIIVKYFDKMYIAHCDKLIQGELKLLANKKKGKND